MFGYVTFNMKYYILSQIFCKKIGWVCNSDWAFTQLAWWGTCLLGCRLKDYSIFVVLPCVWMNDFCPYFAWLGSIIMCSLAHKPWNHLLTQLTVKGGVSVLATENKRRRRIKIRKIPNRKTALLLSEFFQIVWGRPCYFKLLFRIKEIRIVCEQRNYCPPRYITLH